MDPRSDDVSLGEVYRICVEIRNAQKKLEARVAEHDGQLRVLNDRSNRGATLWGALGGVISGFTASWLGKA